MHIYEFIINIIKLFQKQYQLYKNTIKLQYYNITINTNYKITIKFYSSIIYR